MKYPLKLLFIFALFIAGSAFAGVPDMDSNALMTAANSATDPIMSATGWANRLFGDIFMNPFSGEPDTAIGGIIVIMNLSLMLMGTVWVTYKIVSAGAMTAQHGEFLGRTMHSAWVPIRLVIGAGSLAPFFNGFCAAQIVMLMAIKLSIGAGNMAFQAGADYIADHNGLVKPAMTAANNTDIVNQVFQSNLCMLGLNDGMALMNEGGVPQWRKIGLSVTNPSSTPNPTSVQFSYSNSFGDAICGSYSVPATQQNAFKALNDSLYSVAYNLNGQTTQVLTHTPGVDTMPNYDPSIIDQESQNYAQSLQAIAATLTENAMNAQDYANEMRTNAKDASDVSGFVSAGAFAFTIASKNSNLNQQISAAPKSIKAPINPDDSAIESYSNVYRYTMTMVSSAAKDSGKDEGSASGEGFLMNKAIGKVCPKLGNIGECAASWIVSDSDQESALIRIARVGDNLTWVGGILKVTAEIASEAQKALNESGVGKISGFFGAKTLASPVNGAVNVAVESMSYAGDTLFIFGLFACTYIPLVPAIVWLYRLVGMMAIWFEGVVAASVWAWSHLDTEGEGLGQRAAHGYLFVFAVLLNPMLMVLGLFAGLGILDIASNFLTHMFPSMIADIGQNSMVGLFKITAILMVFVLMNLGLVNACSQLINVIPDQVIAWAGGQFQQQIGRSSADEISGKFDAGVSKIRFGTGMDLAKAQQKAFNSRVATAAQDNED